MLLGRQGAAKGVRMINEVMNFVFRCSHRRITRPFSPRTNQGNMLSNVYVVCLDCGRQLEYDWTEMRVGKPVARVVETSAKTKTAAA
jgi:hypothetical protein